MCEHEQVLLKTRLFQVTELTYTSAGGSPVRRQIVRHPGAVTVIPVVDDEHVCLIKNFRVSVGQTLLELPAGTRDHGKPPERTAARELIEETGYRAARIQRLTSFYTSPGILDEEMHLYVASELTAGPPARETGEDIVNHLISWDEALQAVRNGSIQDAKTIIGLLVYDNLRRS